MPRTIVVGDIHGCLAALNALVNAIQLQPDDTLVTVGDYVDRGPQSRGVIERLIELKSQCTLVPLLGNHEEMMIEVIEGQTQPYGWLNHGGVETMDSYGFTGDLTCVPQSHRDFLRGLASYFENDSHFVVHANFDPNIELASQPTDLLRWVKISQQLPRPHVSGKRAIVGHTHDREGRVFIWPHLICLDTYCYGGKWLTALDIDTEQIWQSDRNGNLRETPPDIVRFT
jgi:serine/threonine protein phosphatase 1